MVGERAVAMLGRDLFELLLRDYRINRRRSLRAVEGKIRNHFAPRWADTPVAEITTAAVETYKANRLDAGAAPATVRLELSFLRRAFAIAVRLELLDRVPVFELPQVDNAREGFLAPAEAEQAFRTLDVLSPPVADAVRLCCYLGWRREEVLGLTWAEVNLEEGLLALPARRTKGKRCRRIPFTKELGELFERRWKDRDGPYVFQRRGRQVREFRGPWRRAVEALGRPELVLHDLRRSWARNAVQAGLDRKTIKLIGGWKTDHVFERYQIVVEEDLARGLRRVFRWAKSATRRRRRKRPGESA